MKLVQLDAYLCLCMLYQVVPPHQCCMPFVYVENMYFLGLHLICILSLHIPIAVLYNFSQNIPFYTAVVISCACSEGLGFIYPNISLL
ncbi:hypothetical protein ACJX0J_032969, partial [Zea mays]